MKTRISPLRLLLISLGLLLGVAGGEVMVRLLVRYGPEYGYSSAFVKVMHQKAMHGPHDVPRPGPGQNALYWPSDDPELRYEHGKNWRDGKIRINSSGFRGPEVSSQRETDEFRIAVVGDSETFCKDLEEDETFPSQLGKFVTAPRGFRTIQSLNYGVAGYNVVEVSANVRKNVLPANPSLIVYVFTLNDVFINTPTILLGGRWFSGSYLALFLRFHLRPVDPLDKFFQDTGDPCTFYNRAYESPRYFEATKRILTKLSEDVQARGIPFYLVTGSGFWGRLLLS
jgi:hypothetical protein